MGRAAPDCKVRLSHGLRLGSDSAAFSRQSMFSFLPKRAKAFRGLQPRVHFSCLPKRNRTKEKGTPLPRPAGILPTGSAPACGVFRRHILVPSENAPTSCRRPFGQSFPATLRAARNEAASLCRCRGAPEKQRASCAPKACARSALNRGQESALFPGAPLERWWADTGPSGPARRKRHGAQTARRVCCAVQPRLAALANRAARVAGGLDTTPTGCSEAGPALSVPDSALHWLDRRPACLRQCAWIREQTEPVPFVPGGSRGSLARRGDDTMSSPFRQHKDVLSKSPAGQHEPGGQDARRARKRGGLSFGSFSLAKQRK